MMDGILTRKRIVIGLLVIFALILLQFLFTHSILTVSGSDGEEKIISLYSGSKTTEKKFVITDNSKTFILSKGSYTLEAVSKDKRSIYQKSLGGLSKNDLSVQVMPQKKAIALGANELGCAADQTAIQLVIYYPCNPSISAVLARTANGQEITRNVDSPDPTRYARVQDAAEGPSSSIKLHKDGFIKANVTEKTLRIASLDSKGDFRGGLLAEISNFNGQINDETFAVSSGEKGGYAAFDDEKKTLLLFDGASQEPSRIDLAKNLYFEEGYQRRIFASDKFVFILNTLISDGHGENDQKPPAKQKVVIIDVGAPKVANEYDLPETLQARRANISPNGNFLIADEAVDKKPYIIFGGSEPRQFDGFSQGVRNICWKDDRSFYYSGESNKAIYLFSIDQQASFLIYENPGQPIVTLACTLNKLNFSLSPRDNGPTDDDVFEHFTLSQQDKTGARPEIILPLYLEVRPNLLLATIFKDTITIKNTFALPGEQNIPANVLAEQAKKQILEKLRGNGVDTATLNFSF